MRVFRARNGAGFLFNESVGRAVSTPPQTGVRSDINKRMRQRERIGVLVPSNVQSRRRKPSHNGHGLPRTKAIGCMVDDLVSAAVKAEAAKRGIPLAALTGSLIEVIVNDDLFEAILGPIGGA
jgi:hypothetical protein